MKKVIKKLIIIFIIFGSSAAFIVMFRTAPEKDIIVEWGKGNLKSSEISYYTARIERIGDYWMRTAEMAGRTLDGRIKEPYPTYLVIDTLKPAMWLETAGEIDQDYYTELPENMKWKLYRASPDDNNDLSPVVRLKIRGLYTNQILPEIICVHSYGRSQDHFSFYLQKGNINVDYGNAAFPVQKCRGKFVEGVDYYDSMIVSDEEYNISIESAKNNISDIIELKNNFSSQVPGTIENWLAVEKELHLQIEKQAKKMDFEIYKMTITSGPDYTAGHAALRLLDEGFFKKIKGSSRSCDAYLKLDYLGGGIWYLRSALHSDHHPISGNESPYFEFLVSADNIPKSEVNKWRKKGRQIPEQTIINIDPAYSIKLPNGITIEFFGLCINPSGGNKWWGPDGRILEQSPYYNSKSFGYGGEDRQIYEMAWRITGAQRTSYSMEGSSGSYYHLMKDKYGNDFRILSTEGQRFDKDRQKTNWQVSAGTSDKDFQWVQFRNISLVPGQDFGFQIVEGKPF